MNRANCIINLTSTQKASEKMQYWNHEIVDSLRDRTGGKAHELMALVNKMSKGEDIPEQMVKYYIEREEDEVLLESLGKSLRKVLDKQEIWTHKSSVDLTAESDTE